MREITAKSLAIGAIPAAVFAILVCLMTIDVEGSLNWGAARVAGVVILSGCLWLYAAIMHHIVTKP
jgi:hypothetical protein